MSKELAKTYDPSGIEDRLYQKWLDKKYFHAEVDHSKTPFTIVIPPPNITGQLHMGHALDNTMQDILIRYKRMQGYNALWQPGTDHASIATEVKIIQKLKEEGIDKHDLGREKFLERAWEWKKEYGGRIIEQLKKLGSSCDWDRERFTMDEGCNKAVTEVFVKMHEKGYIYKGARIVNWCPVCNTSISDAEVEYQEQAGHFWHIKYPLMNEDGTPSTTEFLTFATTRPETMLGDTAVAIHPDDERYTHLHGRKVLLPIVNRVIPIVEDAYVDREFGTGVVKITPAHDPNDFEVGKRHDLPMINILNDDATINKNGGKFEGMDRYEARKAIVEELDQMGLLVKIEDHVHNVGTHDRCKTTIEPMVKDQWFVKMDELIKPAREAKGARIVNWCPVCNTSISDAEVEYQEQAGHFWHIKYPLMNEDGTPSTTEFLTFATTRPETMLGDTAVAIHPDDERYTHLHGRKVLLPIVNRVIPIVEDAYVDREFGTGVVKITPAHDPNDFEVGKRHNLPVINILNDDATINKNGGKFEGMDRYEARKAIVEELDQMGLLVKIEDHVHNVGTHDRCKTTIEPMVKDQWFVKMDELIKPAREAVKNGEIKLIPERMEKNYFNWTDNIRDWCISRQLWWGHRIPAYYCDDCGEVVVAKEMPKVCPKCGCTHFTQDHDTLDTWFSSALWPFETLGWPEQTEDLKYFYPSHRCPGNRL